MLTLGPQNKVRKNEQNVTNAKKIESVLWNANMRKKKSINKQQSFITFFTLFHLPQNVIMAIRWQHFDKVLLRV